MTSTQTYPKAFDPKPYAGKTIHLVIGIDVGTMYSGVSYSVLRPGEVPKAQTVTRFTDQTSGDHKIPSIMYYDNSLKVRAAGATAVTESIKHEAEFEGWYKVEYFKLHLRPSNMRLNTNELEIKALPLSLTAVGVMGDFLGYLFQETLKYIRSHHTDGEDIITQTKNRITFVLSHPNGWAGLPQQKLREAAIHGGLIEDTTFGKSRIRFVSEGEASALACLASHLCPPDLKPGYRFTIADAGGGTLDITSYEITHTSPVRMKEITSSDCRFAGSIFVNMKMRELLKKKLAGSHYLHPELLEEIVNETFENTTKREFAESTKICWLQVGGRTETNPALGIRKGTLRLDGTELADCFTFPISEALQSIRQQRSACGTERLPVWLVGGFGSSPYLYNELKRELEADGVSLSRPDINISKAVANGDIYYALEHVVTGRVTKMTYGVECDVCYKPSDPDHVRRKHKVYNDVAGRQMLPSRFRPIVAKNAEVKETDAFAEWFTLYVPEGQDASSVELLYGYDGPAKDTMWADENRKSLNTLCCVSFDFTHLCKPENILICNGERFWVIKFQYEILFGSTELFIRAKWEEDGKIRFGPASIFYAD